jgi:hypothetical protein
LYHAITNAGLDEVCVIKPLMRKNKAGLIEEQDLDPVGASGSEHKQGATEWITAECFLHNRGKTIVSLAKIDRPRREIDL